MERRASACDSGTQDIYVTITAVNIIDLASFHELPVTIAKPFKLMFKSSLSMLNNKIIYLCLHVHVKT